jgi:hypothetical protein
MLNLMDAEILFPNPADVNPAIAELIKRDFSVEIRKDKIDEGGPTVFIRATVFTEHDDSTFHSWVQAIVEPLGGDVWEAGHAYAGIDGADDVTMDRMRANDNVRLRLIQP